MSTRSNAPADLDQHVSNRIRKIRMQRGLTLKEAADKVGLMFQQYHKYEAGLLRVSAGLLVSLAEIFDCEVSDFFPPELRGDSAADLDLRVEILKQEIMSMVRETTSEKTLLAFKILLERQSEAESNSINGATG